MTNTLPEILENMGMKYRNEKEGPPFNPGDVIKCINVQGFIRGKIELGKTYTVKGLSFWHTWFVEIGIGDSDFGSEWFAQRFELENQIIFKTRYGLLQSTTRSEFKLIEEKPDYLAITREIVGR